MALYDAAARDALQTANLRHPAILPYGSCGEHAREPPVSILKRMDRQKRHDEDGDDEERVQCFLIQRFSRPGDERLHLARRVERRGRFEHNADLLPVRIERHNVVGERLIGAAMVRILVAVTQ